MSSITKPILLDDTGKDIVNKLQDIANAVRGFDYETSTWSITINEASASTLLPAMGGDHTSWLIYRAKIGRYFVTNAGKAKKLDKHNSRLLEDGTEVDESTGHIMVRLPRLYYKVSTADSLVTITMAEREFAENCEEFDEQWVGAYMGAVVSNALVSRSGINPTRSLTISQFWAKAQANGTKWGLMDYTQQCMLNLLYLCEYLDLNSQAALGNGMTGNGNNWCEPVYNAVTGMTAELGDECGKVNFTEDGQLVGGACHTSIFGLEDAYGWFWSMLQGCYFGSSENDEQEGTEMFVYEHNAMPTTEELATHPSGTYRQLVRPTDGGWVSKMILGDKCDMFPKAMGASSTTYWSDYHYANSTGQLLLWGGYANDGSSCGFAYSNSYYSFSSAYSRIGSRLAYHGKDMEIIG